MITQVQVRRSAFSEARTVSVETPEVAEPAWCGLVANRIAPNAAVMASLA
jgi:hypothetical protein